ncbi:MAG TPA: nitroreductase/quinone reductase family protein [Candidatus Dormibacteraeota bacterium]|nr:nitroreductase/quinone reductase family protein [Candidatus Dormibacteraeota bacterium]
MLRVLISRVLQRSMIALNPVMRRILGGRLHRLASANLMLLNFRGRMSGRSFTTPVSYVQIGDNLYVPGGGAWWKNLAGGPVKVRLDGVWLSATPAVISESAAMSAALARMIARRPLVGLFTAIRVGHDGLPTPASLERARTRHGLAVIRLHLDNSAEIRQHAAA